MRVSFLDLDDDNHEFLVIDTIIPSSVISDGTILDYIMEDQFIDEKAGSKFSAFFRFILTFETKIWLKNAFFECF